MSYKISKKQYCSGLFLYVSYVKHPLEDLDMALLEVALKIEKEISGKAFSA